MASALPSQIEYFWFVGVSRCETICDILGKPDRGEKLRKASKVAMSRGEPVALRRISQKPWCTVQVQLFRCGVFHPANRFVIFLENRTVEKNYEEPVKLCLRQEQHETMALRRVHKTPGLLCHRKHNYFVAGQPICDILQKPDCGRNLRRASKVLVSRRRMTRTTALRTVSRRLVSGVSSQIEFSVVVFRHSNRL